MTMAYVFTFFVGWFGMNAVGTGVLWLDCLAFHLFTTLGIFLCSLLYNNSSLYDPFWSILPIWLVLYGASQTGSIDPSEVLLLLMVCAWGVRLTWNFLKGWPGMAHEDWRYVNFRRTTGQLYWLVSFSGIHLFPTLLVYAGLSSVLFLFQAEATSTTPLTWLGAALGVVAIAIETIADNQLRAFVHDKKEKGSIMKTGLWRYSRHPNYFGELLFWWSCCLCAWGSAPLPYWVWAGPLSMTALFYFASIPMLDKRSLERRPAYEAHMRSTSSLIPWPPKS